MSALIDLTDRTFERLQVIRRAGMYGVKGRSMATWLCRCECGAEVVVLSNNLRTGNTKSCGCIAREAASQRMKERNKRRDHVRKSPAEA